MCKEYYNKYANEFIESTMNVDMSELYAMFEKYLPETGKILDIGFGSGRDSLYFSKKYEVVSIDNSETFVVHAKNVLTNKVILLDVRDISFDEEFDGIWACASLLHLRYHELPEVLNKCYRSLKPNGIMYMSFKYGDFEGERNGRYFTDLNEERFNNMLLNSRFKLLELKITNDFRPDRYDKWLNVIIRKS